MDGHMTELHTTHEPHFSIEVLDKSSLANSHTPATANGYIIYCHDDTAADATADTAAFIL